jgi:glycosyltransferase involved in cell wall biosynthesis
MPTETLLSVVAPLTADTPASVGAFILETERVLQGLVSHYEIVLVDDGVPEATVSAVRDLLTRHEFVRFVRLSRHFGEETAIAAGLDVAIGDYVVVMLPNMDPPTLIPAFLERARGGADIVYGVRIHRHMEPLWYRVGARTFYWYLNRVVRAGLPEDSTQFRCMTRQVVNAITQIRDPGRYLRSLTSYVGFRKEALPYAPVNRTGKPTVRPPGEALGLARALIIENTTHPLRWAGWTGVALSIVLLAGVAAWTMAAGAVRSLVWLLATGQLVVLSVVLAVIAEYVAGLSRRFRDRPEYYVREEEASSVLLREERINVVSSTRETPLSAKLR